jgi:Zn-finger nucleic acid-binding protein
MSQVRVLQRPLVCAAFQNTVIRYLFFLQNEMAISSRNPEGQPNYCPICRKAIVMEPSQPFGDAPCPHCGSLLLFEPLDNGFRISLAKAIIKGARPVVVRRRHECPQCKTIIPPGTESKPAPDRCPTCQGSLNIPTLVENLRFSDTSKRALNWVTRTRHSIRAAVLGFLRTLRRKSRSN